jgi:hypothetical protein
MMSTLINATLNPVVGALRRFGLLAADLDYHIVRASMAIMFFFFGYQKWWAYEVGRLEPFISNGPLIWWLYPVLGTRAPVGSWVSVSGASALCCSRGSGINGSASLELPVQPLRSLGPSHLMLLASRKRD